MEVEEEDMGKDGNICKGDRLIICIKFEGLPVQKENVSKSIDVVPGVGCI